MLARYDAAAFTPSLKGRGVTANQRGLQEAVFPSFSGFSRLIKFCLTALETSEQKPSKADLSLELDFLGLMSHKGSPFMFLMYGYF